MDPITEVIEQRGLPKTRETYLALAFMPGEEQLDAEFEASLPDYAKKPSDRPLEDTRIEGRLDSK